MTPTIIFLSIATLFIALMLFQAISKWKFCALCASVSLTWLTLLAAYKLEKFNNPVILALLMGQSVVGVFYLVEKKVEEKYRLFRMPFVLTLTAVFYLALDATRPAFTALLVPAGLWLVMLVIYISREQPRLKTAVEKIINCCKNW